ncbi:ELKS/Rab6-interacting/CAST family member 1-like [Limulus polyphemus]|uniref:ELKS/Rab6-interacting/CAST family member 1-like n=1 Tax=Limulus polyphemus TaxID=6850 RepID=A0ABM1C355_LIMPO|nr:ELKS/Rab6-interacting/CAST family member 1-like [Limulus polyphemus]
MSRDLYAGVPQRSPRMSRRQEMATLGHGLSSKSYTSISQPPSGRGSPVTPRVHSSPSQVRKSRQYGVSRSSNNSPLNLPQDSYIPHSFSSGGFHASQGYYSDNPGSPVMDVRTSSSAPNSSHRSGSTTRDASRNYHSLERVQEREFVPIREPRERSLDRGDTSRHPRSRERSLERSGYRDREMERDAYYRDRETAIDVDGYRDSGHHIPRATHSSYASNSERPSYSRDNFIMEIQSRLNDLQSHYDNVKRELDVTTQKLGSSMHSIKTFWSPELKKERALRKEEAAKYTLINDQLKILRSENQVR